MGPGNSVGKTKVTIGFHLLIKLKSIVLGAELGARQHSRGRGRDALTKRVARWGGGSL